VSGGSSGGTRVFQSIERLKAVHRNKFDPAEIHPGLRRCAVTTDARVKLATGEFGVIGISQGWRPVLLLMNTHRSLGSSRILSAGDHVTHIRVGGRYVPWHTFENERPAA